MIENGTTMTWGEHRLRFDDGHHDCMGCFFENERFCPECDYGIWVDEGTSDWHTGIPGEEGQYWVAYRWGLDNRIMHDMTKQILYGAATFRGGVWNIDYPYMVVAWIPIRPYKEDA